MLLRTSGRHFIPTDNCETYPQGKDVQLMPEILVHCGDSDLHFSP
jgi:hypothetical protein